MICALLDGRKSQTRRIVKPQPQNDPARHHPISPYRTSTGDWNWILSATGHGTGDPFPCPYGQPGDLLWVRETFAKIDGQTRPWIETDYRATYTHGDRLGDSLGIKKKWTSSIHMPRLASRLTLRVTNISVERLQDITEKDARAEGVERCWCSADACPKAHSFRGEFRGLWHDINGAKSWAANPWVWALTFDVIQANVDDVLKREAA